MEQIKPRISTLFYVLTVLFVSCLIVSNIMAVKLAVIGPFVLPAAVLVFPITYIFGDVLTEVYGYRRARLVIWLGFIANLIVVLFIKLAEVLPSAGFWQGQAAYSQTLGSTPRILAASFLAYLAGEFLNSFVLAKLKIFTKGKMLWTRTIGSTVVGQFADSGIFITLAFIGTMPNANLFQLFVTQWLFKVAYEVICTPLTYLVVGKIKKHEGSDVYDHGTNFNPFKVADVA